MGSQWTSAWLRQLSSCPNQELSFGSLRNGEFRGGHKSVLRQSRDRTGVQSVVCDLSPKARVPCPRLKYPVPACYISMTKAVWPSVIPAGVCCRRPTTTQPGTLPGFLFSEAGRHQPKPSQKPATHSGVSVLCLRISMSQTRAVE